MRAGQRAEQRDKQRGWLYGKSVRSQGRVAGGEGKGGNVESVGRGEREKGETRRLTPATINTNITPTGKTHKRALDTVQ